MTSPERCERLVCRIANLTTSRPAVVTLTVVTDERFLFVSNHKSQHLFQHFDQCALYIQNMGSAFTLVTSASIQVHDRFIEIEGTLSNTVSYNY